jgi:hypothetical protein
MDEEPLEGGRQTVGVVRVGDTVRRPLQPNSERVHAVLRHLEAVGLIDWDNGVGPGRRLDDLAHAVWCFVDVGEHGGGIEDQGRRVRLMCDSYGWNAPALVIHEIATLLRRARDRHARAGRGKAVAIFDDLLAWMEDHGSAVEAASVTGGRTG